MNVTSGNENTGAENEVWLSIMNSEKYYDYKCDDQNHMAEMGNVCDT